MIHIIVSIVKKIALITSFCFHSFPKSINMPSIINRDAPQYFIISGFIYLPKVAPIITETAVIIMYAQTDPKNTEKGS